MKGLDQFVLDPGVLNGVSNQEKTEMNRMYDVLERQFSKVNFLAQCEIGVFFVDSKNQIYLMPVVGDVVRTPIILQYDDSMEHTRRVVGMQWNGQCLVVYGLHFCCIVVVGDNVFGAVLDDSVELPDFIVCKSMEIDVHYNRIGSSSIKQVKWSPLDNDHLFILYSNEGSSNFKMFHIETLPHLNDTQISYEFDHSLIAFDFGCNANYIDWMEFSVFFVDSHAQLFVLCPIVPEKSRRFNSFLFDLAKTFRNIHSDQPTETFFSNLKMYGQILNKENPKPKLQAIDTDIDITNCVDIICSSGFPFGINLLSSDGTISTLLIFDQILPLFKNSSKQFSLSAVDFETGISPLEPNSYPHFYPSKNKYLLNVFHSKGLLQVQLNWLSQLHSLNFDDENLNIDQVLSDIGTSDSEGTKILVLFPNKKKLFGYTIFSSIYYGKLIFFLDENWELLRPIQIPEIAKLPTLSTTETFVKPQKFKKLNMLVLDEISENYNIDNDKDISVFVDHVEKLVIDYIDPLKDNYDEMGKVIRAMQNEVDYLSDQKAAALSKSAEVIDSTQETFTLLKNQEEKQIELQNRLVSVYKRLLGMRDSISEAEEEYFLEIGKISDSVEHHFIPEVENIKRICDEMPEIQTQSQSTKNRSALSEDEFYRYVDLAEDFKHEIEYLIEIAKQAKADVEYLSNTINPH